MKYSFLLFLLFFFACKQDPPLDQIESAQQADVEIPQPPNELYGPLFRQIQMGRLFPDGKTFVDVVPKVSPDSIMRAYETATNKTGFFDLELFVHEHFDLPPKPAGGFQSDPDRSIVEHINSLWPVLTRQADDEADNASSLIPLPNDYIVPGGRFREIYYWDSYFTMLGLIESGQLDMAENMVDNFAYLIETVGFIPNGNRNYYLTRSQPPFFSMMVELLAIEKGDQEIMLKNLPAMEAEYRWWMLGEDELTEANPANLHCVRMPDGSMLNRYYDRGDYPRAESYKEDVETIEEAVSRGRDAATVARHIRSGAESGWDYSSRWFADGQNMHTIETTDIVPPDLNSLLLELELNLELGYDMYGDTEKSAEYKRRYEIRKESINKYLYNSESGYYEDFRWSDTTHTGRISLASLFPLAVRAAGEEQAATVAVNIERDFLSPGGLPATLSETGQQWDAPNGWPNLQYMAVLGLQNYGESELARQIATRWMANNERVYENVNKMVEKYNVYDLSLEAGGGEYPVQDGFGWSNGVYLAFKAMYPDAE
ncbi:MAG: alpha,alpha-trehalase TreF [Bacteroidota bacterium]